MTTAVPRAVMFDLDGVLYDFHPEIRASILAERSGVDPGQIAGIFRSPFEAEAEAGCYATGDEYLAAFNQSLRTSITREEWIAARQAAMQPRAEMIALALELSAAMPVGVLTNNGALLREALSQLVAPLWSRIGARCWASCEFGARKPETVVFLRMAARLERPPGDILFIDDSAANCDGAREAGLQALHFRDGPSAVAAIQRHFH
jgi:putative hydrolase of the HAD superfamily